MKDGSTFRICEECGERAEGMQPCRWCMAVEIEIKKREHKESIFGTVPLHDDQFKIQVLADRKLARKK